MSEIGVSTIGVDVQSKELRIAAFVRRKLKALNVGLLSMHVDPETIRLLPAADTVLLLSVWHHWVKEFDLPAATLMLQEVWQRTNRLLFFETGENEMPDEYRLPQMLPSAEEWLASYLRDTCSSSRVQCLGQMKAFAPGGSETSGVVRRSLFVVMK
jgi:hypothetical protein